MAEHLTCMVNVRMRQELYDKVLAAAGQKSAAEWMRGMIEANLETGGPIIVVLEQLVALRKIELRVVVPMLMDVLKALQVPDDVTVVRDAVVKIDAEKAALAKALMAGR